MRKGEILASLENMNGPLTTGYHITTEINAINIVEGIGEIVGT